MPEDLYVLSIAPSERNVALLQASLVRLGRRTLVQTADTPASFAIALDAREWNVIVAEHGFENFPPSAALAFLEERKLSIPLLVIREDSSPDVTAKTLSAIVPAGRDYRGRKASAGTKEAERIEAEAARRRAEEKYRSIFENAVEGIFQCTPDGAYIAANPALARILGYDSAAELVSDSRQTKFDQYVSPTRRDELLRRLEAQDSVLGFECEMNRKDQSKTWVVENIRVVRDTDGMVQYYEGSIEDITERKQLEDQLRQAQRMEAIGQLTGGIAHDFNNLLTVINGYGDLVLRRLQPHDPLRHNVQQITKAGERAASLTRQLLAFSRKLVLRPAVLDLNSVVTETEKMLRRVIGEDIELHAVLDPDLGRVQADPGQIEQVLMNLVINARDAMPTGGRVTIETQNVYLGADYVKQHIGVSAGSYVMLAVSDTGIGMNANTQERMFEPFFTTKATGKGTGLGLSTVYGIVRQSGGHIGVASEVGQGATFKIYLPCVGDGIQPYTMNAAPKEDLRGNETVLLAEDDNMVRALVRSILEMYGYRVLEARNGSTALSVCDFHKDPIHLLLTDVIMPEMNGPALAERLSQIRPDIKVLFMSGYTNTGPIYPHPLPENVPLIQKPFASDVLARKVKEVLGGVLS